MEIEETELDGDVQPVEGIRATCTRCGLTVEVFGTEEPSRKRAGAELGRRCLLGEKNFYHGDAPTLFDVE